MFAVIDLATLSAAQGSAIFGAGADDNSGFSVSSAGDVNGDGFDDMLIGAVYADALGNAKSNAGESYVVFGGPSISAAIDLASLGTAGVTIFGVDPDDQSGSSISKVGDINGDGFDDLMIGARFAGASANAKPFAGESYLIFGAAALPATIDLASLGVAGITIFGADLDDFSSKSFSNAGDVNGDGFDDMLIGAYGAGALGNAKAQAGESYLIFGAASMPATIDLANLGTAGVTIYGSQATDQSGFSVSSAGDVNGDGLDDLLIGAPDDIVTASGDSYLIFGSVSLPTTIDLATLGAAGVKFFGVDVSDRSGASLSRAGDVNGDGFDDLLVGARFAGASGNAKALAGDSYVIFGGASLPTTINLATLGTAGITIFGADVDDQSGRSVSAAGDVNGDGFDDLLIGAYFAGASGNTKALAGESYVIFGGGALPSTIDLATLGAAGITIFGAEAGDQSGWSVSGAGDVNGDGFDDVLIGAIFAAGSGNSRSQSGESYLVYGSDFTAAITHPGSAVGETLTGNAAANVMIGGRGNDTLLGNGGADVLTGGQGNDVMAVSDLAFRRLVGGTGSDTIRLDGSGLSLNLTTLRDNRLLGIEQIDITGSGNNTLILNQREVLNLSDESNTLVVRRNAGDVVNILDLGSWTQAANETIGPDIFRVYVQGAAKLKVANVAPILTRTLATATGNVLSVISNSGTYSDDTAGAVTLSVDVGTIVNNNNGTWTWSVTPSAVIVNQTVTVTAVDEDGGSSTVTFTLNATAAVVNSKVYYKGSSFSQGGTNVNAALDTGKSLAKSGSTPVALSYSNLTNSTRGINGLVFDVAGATNVTASDLAFRMSPTGLFNEAANQPNTWSAPVPTPTAIVFTPGTASTPARVRVEWADNDIRNRWLQIRILPTSNTKLTVQDTYYIGHLQGEVNGQLLGGGYFVQNSDLNAVLPVSVSALVTSNRDIDKSGFILNADLIAVRAAVNGGFSLRNITIPAAGSIGEGEGSVMAPMFSALAASSTPSTELARIQEPSIGPRWTGLDYSVPQADEVAKPKSTVSVYGPVAASENEVDESVGVLAPIDDYFAELGKKKAKF